MVFLNLSSLKNLFLYILRLGTSGEDSKISRYIIISNLIAFTSILSLIAHYINLILYTYTFFNLLILLYIVINIFILYLNSIKLYQYTVYITLFFANIFIFIFNIMFSYKTGIYLFYYSCSIIPFFYIPISKRKVLSISIIFSILLYYISINNIFNIDPIYNLPDEKLSNMYFIVTINIFIILVISGFYSSWMIENSEKIITEKNTLLLKRNELIASELSLARMIQNSLIPGKEVPGYIYSLYKPMNQIGGDFYDYILFRNSNKIGLFICDVSGHGVPAALVTAMLKATILQSGFQRDNPKDFLYFLNGALYNQIAGYFITAFYGIYNPEERTLIYANAGHNQPLLIKSQSVTPIPKGSSPPLALFTNDELKESKKSFENISIKFSKNSKLLLYTDGFTDAVSHLDENIYYENNEMIENILKFRDCDSKEFIQKMNESLIEFRGSDSFDDDICLVVVDIQ